MVGLMGCCHRAHTTTLLGSLLVLRVVERWLDVISSTRSAVLRSLHSWRTSAVLPARLRSSALSFLISTPCSRLAATFPSHPARLPWGVRAPPNNPPCRFAKPQGSARGNAGAGEQIRARGISGQRHLLQQPWWEPSGGASHGRGGPSPGGQEAAAGAGLPVYQREGGWGVRGQPRATRGSCTPRWK